ncbi:MAG: hypothetical protein ACI8ZM_001177 [Crocinitomix sp.]|jgi:hypothetical protein
MNQTQFENIVESDHYLNMLINKQTYGIKASIKKTSTMTPAFIDWVSPKYYDSFKNIYDRNKDKNPMTVAAVVNECFLGKPEVHEALALLFMSNVDQALAASTKFHKTVSILKDVALEEFPKFNTAVDDLSFAAIRSIDTVEIRKKREQFAENLLATINLLDVKSKSRSPKEFKVYEKLTAILERMNLDGEQKEQVVSHEKIVNKKNTWYIIGVVLFILFILIKWMLRFSR